MGATTECAPIRFRKESAMVTKKRYIYRYLLIALVFCMVCVIYVGRLFYIQITGRDGHVDDGVTESYVKIQAVRGEILDRNGKTLVANQYAYTLTVNYAGISTVGISGANRVYLKLFDALDACGLKNAHEELYFPFEGSYPDYAFSSSAMDGESPINFRLQRLLEMKGMDPDATAKEIVEEYLDAYRLLEVDALGKRIYTDYQIDRLLRLHYDMEAQQFSLVNDYVFAEDTGFAFMTYVSEMSLTGVDFQVNAQREYRYPGYASHILGNVGPIYAEEWGYYNDQGYQMNAIVGKTGCELAFEEYLHGTDGEMLVKLDRNGSVIATEVITPPVAGKDVYLTIDIDLQIAAEDGLRANVEYLQENNTDGLEQFPPDSGAAVAMDPNTFEILAIASYPTYDLTTYSLDYNDLVASSARPLVNRALRETYAPGSTFKVGVGLAALCEGKITPTGTVKCTGIYYSQNFSGYHPACSTYDQHASSPYLNVVRALSDSCNCFFYQAGEWLGIGKMDEYMAAMGFGRNTGVELSEATGVLAGEGNYVDKWQPGNTVQAAIGQSDNKATPLQLCAYLSTVVNGGSRYSAHLLDRVCEFGIAEPLYSDVTSAEPLSSLEISPVNYATIMEGLYQMVSDSTAIRRYLADNNVDYRVVGGKTGTAQIDRYVTDEKTGETVKYELTNGLFVGVYAPEEAPELVVSVVIENAAHGYFAGMTAASIFGAWEQIGG